MSSSWATDVIKLLQGEAVPDGLIHVEVMAAVRRNRRQPWPVLEAEARQAFAAALRTRCIDPSPYRLEVYFNQVLGPICYVHHASGVCQPLAEFAFRFAN